MTAAPLATRVKGQRLTTHAAPGPGFKQLEADQNRKERRALVKALGSRQFKKLYRSAP